MPSFDKMQLKVDEKIETLFGTKVVSFSITTKPLKADGWSGVIAQGSVDAGNPESVSEIRALFKTMAAAPVLFDLMQKVNQEHDAAEESMAESQGYTGTFKCNCSFCKTVRAILDGITLLATSS